MQSTKDSMFDHYVSTNGWAIYKFGRLLVYIIEWLFGSMQFISWKDIRAYLKAMIYNKTCFYVIFVTFLYLPPGFKYLKKNPANIDF